MAELSYPAATYNSGAVTDAEYQRVPWGPDGLTGLPSEASGVEAVYANSSGREVHIRAARYGAVLGRAWSSGASETNLTIDANTSGSTRIDTVVLRLDRSTWLVRAAIRKGTPGAGVPALVRQTGDTGLFEVPLADVTVGNGVSVITGANVRMRALYQAGAIRPAKGLADVQQLLTAGDVVYTGGRWLGWNGAATQVLGEDTGDVGTAVGFADGWQLVDSNVVRRMSGWCELTVQVRRINTTWTTTDTDGTHIVTVPTGHRPARYKYCSVQFTGGLGARLEIRTDGTVWGTNPDGNIGPGRFLRHTFTYLPAPV